MVENASQISDFFSIMGNIDFVVKGKGVKTDAMNLGHLFIFWNFSDTKIIIDFDCLQILISSVIYVSP